MHPEELLALIHHADETAEAENHVTLSHFLAKGLCHRVGVLMAGAEILRSAQNDMIVD
jgi:hypothetical protein